MQYDNLSKEELLKLIKKQELDLKSKKYGLVWDDEKEPEQVVLDCKDNLPILRRIKGKEIKEPKDNTQEDNILIEGDNYHALTVLNYTHQEKIDVIYIDPPYNTGKKNEWKYNDNYVDKNDGYKHSKWLNFMSKRLKLAKNLLKKEGLIFISIDDNEIGNIRLLCDNIFGEHNFVNIICQKSRHSMSNDLIISENHNYLLFYAKDKNTLFKNRFSFRLKKEDFSSYSNPDNDPEGAWKWGPVDGPGGESKGNPHYEFQGVKGYWRHSKKDMQKLFDKGKIRVTKNNLNKKYYQKDDKGIKAVSTWWDDVGTTTEGTNDFKKVLGNKDFNNPKPLKLIKRIVELSLEKEGLVLDFFAGSGTTGQAIFEMNEKDGGNRKFILCTNNENNICTDITYPRIEKVIKGYDFKGKDKTILFEKKLTFSNLYKKIKQKKNESDDDFKTRKEEELNKNISKIWKEVDKIILDNKENFDDIEKEFKNNTLKIIGIKNIDGKKEGLGGNLQYFKTSLIKTTKNRDQTKINLTQKCTEMLCLKENIFNVEIENDDFKIFSSNKKEKFLCVYYNFIEESFEEFLKEIKKLKGEKIIYMFSLEDKIDKSLFKEVKNCKLEAIPKKILEIYKKLVKMNIPIKAETIFIDLEKAKKQIFEDKDKDTGAKTLRVVLEKLVQKIAQKNQVNILTDKGKEIKLSTLNDTLKSGNVFTKVEWEENKTYLTIGNHASHGEYDEFDLTQVNKFYKHIQTLINKFNI